MSEGFGFEHENLSASSMGTPTIRSRPDNVVASVFDRGGPERNDRRRQDREYTQEGETIASIARSVGVSEPTVRKYARMEDFSPEPPRCFRQESCEHFDGRVPALSGGGSAPPPRCLEGHLPAHLLLEDARRRVARQSEVFRGRDALDAAEGAHRSQTSQRLVQKGGSSPIGHFTPAALEAAIANSSRVIVRSLSPA